MADAVAATSLRSYIERVERLEEEKSVFSADIREVYAEAKGEGFDAKTMREIVKLRKVAPSDRDEQEALLDLYKHTLGMLADTPLGQAAMAAAVPVKAERDIERGALA